VFDMTKEQIFSFFSAIAANPIYSEEDKSLIETTGIAIGICGIRHSDIMHDMISNELLTYMTSVDCWISDKTILQPFLLGTCTFWEALLKCGDKEQIASRFEVLILPAPTLDSIPWKVREDVRVIELVQRISNVHEQLLSQVK